MSKPEGWKVVTYKDLEESSEEPNTEEVKKEAIKPHTESRPLIWGDLSAKAFWKRNIFPVLFEAAFLLLIFNNPTQSVYISFFFYLVLFFFYLITRSFTFRNFGRNLTSGYHFWKASLICALLFGSCLLLTFLVGLIFPHLDTGYFPLAMDNNFEVVIYGITVFFLCPIVEEVFFRFNMINLESKSLKAITTVASLLLFAIIHSFSWWGILSAVIWAIPLTVVYIKTRNVYVTIMAHFIVNLITNIPALVIFLN